MILKLRQIVSLLLGIAIVITSQPNAFSESIFPSSQIIIRDLKNSNFISPQNSWSSLTQKLFNKYGASVDNSDDVEKIKYVLKELARISYSNINRLGNTHPADSYDNNVRVDKILIPLELKIDSSNTDRPNIHNDLLNLIVSNIYIRNGISNDNSKAHKTYASLYENAPSVSDLTEDIKEFISINDYHISPGNPYNILCNSSDNKDYCSGIFPLQTQTIVGGNTKSELIWAKDLNAKYFARTPLYQARIAKGLYQRLLDHVKNTEYPNTMSRIKNKDIVPRLSTLMSISGHVNDLRNAAYAIYSTFTPNNNLVTYKELFNTIKNKENYNLNNLPKNILVVIDAGLFPENWEKDKKDIIQSPSIIGFAKDFPNQGLLSDVLVTGAFQDKLKNSNNKYILTGITPQIALGKLYNVKAKKGELNDIIQPLGKDDFKVLANEVLFDASRRSPIKIFSLNRYSNDAIAMNQMSDEDRSDMIRRIFDKIYANNYQDFKYNIENEDIGYYTEDSMRNHKLWGSAIKEYLKVVAPKTQLENGKLVYDYNLDLNSSTDEENNALFNSNIRLYNINKNHKFIPVSSIKIDDTGKHKYNYISLLGDYLDNFPTIENVTLDYRKDIKREFALSIINNLHAINPEHHGQTRLASIMNDKEYFERNIPIFQIAEKMKPITLGHSSNNMSDVTKQIRDDKVQKLVIDHNIKTVGKFFAEKIIDPLFNQSKRPDPNRNSIYDLFTTLNTNSKVHKDICLNSSSGESCNSLDPNLVHNVSVNKNKELILKQFNNSDLERDLLSIYSLNRLQNPGQKDVISTWTMPIGFDKLSIKHIDNMLYDGLNSFPVIQTIIQYYSANPEAAINVIKPIDLAKDVYKFFDKNRNTFYPDEKDAIIPLEMATYRYMHSIHNQYSSKEEVIKKEDKDIDNEIRNRRSIDDSLNYHYNTENSDNHFVQSFLLPILEAKTVANKQFSYEEIEELISKNAKFLSHLPIEKITQLINTIKNKIKSNINYLTQSTIVDINKKTNNQDNSNVSIKNYKQDGIINDNQQNQTCLLEYLHSAGISQDYYPESCISKRLSVSKEKSLPNQEDNNYEDESLHFKKKINPIKSFINSTINASSINEENSLIEDKEENSTSALTTTEKEIEAIETDHTEITKPESNNNDISVYNETSIEHDSTNIDSNLEPNNENRMDLPSTNEVETKDSANTDTELDKYNDSNNTLDLPDMSKDSNDIPVLTENPNIDNKDDMVLMPEENDQNTPLDKNSVEELDSIVMFIENNYDSPSEEAFNQLLNDINSYYYSIDKVISNNNKFNSKKFNNEDNINPKLESSSLGYYSLFPQAQAVEYNTINQPAIENDPNMVDVIPNTSFNQGTILKLPYTSQNNASSYIIVEQLGSLKVIEKYAEELAENYDRIENKDKFDKYFLNKESNLQAISIFDAANNAILKQVQKDNTISSISDKYSSIRAILPSIKSGKELIFGVDADSENNEINCNTSNVNLNSKGCKIKIWNVEKNQYDTFLYPYPFYYIRGRNDYFLGQMMHKIRTKQKPFNNIINEVFIKYLNPLTYDASQKQSDLDSKTEVSTIANLDALKNVFTKKNTVFNHKYDTLQGLFNAAFQEPLGMKKLDRLYGDSLVKVITRDDVGNIDDSNQSQPITTIPGNIWLDIVQQKKGLQIVDKQNEKVNWFITNADYDQTDNFLDFKLGANKYIDSIRRKLSYYGTNSNVFTSKKNPYIFNSINDLSRVSENKFKQLLLSEINKQKPANLTNFSDWVKTNKNIQEEIKDQKIGVSDNNSQLLWYAFVPMHDPMLSPYGIKFVNKYLTDPQFQKIMKVYSPDEAVEMLFNSIKIKPVDALDKDLSLVSNEVYLNPINEAEPKRTLIDYMNLNIYDFIKIFDQALILGLNNYFNVNNEPIASNLENHSFYSLFEGLEDVKVNLLANNYITAYTDNNRVMTRISTQEEIKRAIDDISSAARNTFVLLMKRVKNSEILINKIYNSEVFKTLVQNIDTVNIKTDHNNAQASTVMTELLNILEGAYGRIVESKFSILENEYFNKKYLDLTEVFKNNLNYDVIHIAMSNFNNLDKKIELHNPQSTLLSTWLTLGQSKQFFLENQDDFAEEFIKNKDINKDGQDIIGLRSIMLEQLRIATDSDIWERTMEFLRNDADWFSKDDKIFQPKEEEKPRYTYHSLDIRSLEEYLGPVEGEEEADSNELKKLKRYTNLYNKGNIKWMLVSKIDNYLDTMHDAEDNLYFVNENGDDDNVLGKGKLAAYNILKKGLIKYKGKKIVTADLFEEAVISNIGFSNKIIENNAGVFLNNFLRSQIHDLKGKELNYTNLLRNYTKRLEIQPNFKDLKIHSNLSDIYYTTPEILDLIDLIQNNSKFFDQDILNKGFEKAALSDILENIGINFANHPVLTTLDGKHKILESIDYQALQRLFAEIVTYSYANHHKYYKLKVLRDRVSNEVIINPDIINTPIQYNKPLVPLHENILALNNSSIESLKQITQTPTADNLQTRQICSNPILDEDVYIDYISMEELFESKNIAELSNHQKYNVLRHLVEASLINSGVIIPELKNIVHKLYMINSEVINKLINNMTNYNHVSYISTPSFTYTFDKKHTSYLLSLFNNSKYNDFTTLSINGHYLNGVYRNNDNIDDTVVNILNSYEGFAINKHLQFDFIMNDQMNYFTSYYASYAQIKNSLVKRVELDQYHNIDFNYTNTTIGMTLGTTYFSNAFDNKYNYPNSNENQSFSSIMLDLRYQQNALYSDEYYLDYFNKNYTIDAYINLTGNYLLPIQDQKNNKEFRVNINFAPGIEFITQQFIFNFNIGSSIQFNHYISAEWAYGIKQYIDQSWNHQFNVGLEISL